MDGILTEWSLVDERGKHSERGFVLELMVLSGKTEVRTKKGD